MLQTRKRKINSELPITLSDRQRILIFENGDELEKLLEATGNFVWEINSSGVFVSCGSSSEEILGYRKEELLGKTFFDLILAEDKENAAKWFLQVTASGSLFKQYKTRIKRFSGEVIIMENSGFPLFGSGGELTGYKGISRDITSQIQTEEALRESRHRTQKSLLSLVNVLASTVEQRDPYLAGHQQRVAKLAMAIAKEMNLPFDRLDIIYKAGSLHDIGKISVPAEILSKPGKLTVDEFSLIKVHPGTGYDLLKGTQLHPDVALITLQHHERMDGSGYPNGLSDSEILLEARIIAVADVVESMASDRPYRPSLGIEKALEEINTKSGILYDSQAVDACLKIFNEKRFKFV